MLISIKPAYLLIVLASTFILYVNGFHRETTGVGFSAYIKRSENKLPIPGWKSYTMKDIGTMLEVISTRFSRVATFGVGADNVRYEKNVTYYKSNGQVMTAEVAAIINKERRKKSLALLIGIWQSDMKTQMNSELQVAIESVEKANSIYPGTVEGIVLSQSDIHNKLSRAKQTLEQIRILRNSFANISYDIRLGSRQECYGLSDDNPSNLTDEGRLAITRLQIVRESDFIICTIEPAAHNRPSGGRNGFITVGNDLITFRQDLQEVNPNIEVMGQTGWPSGWPRNGTKKWENVENLKEYWHVVDEWADENKFTMWMVEAFDNPWKDWLPNAAHYGWWWLKRNSLVGSKDGYGEKIIDPPLIENSDEQISAWAIAGIGMGVSAFLIVIAIAVMFYFRIRKLEDALSKQEVKEFMYGVTDEEAAQRGENSAIIPSALNLPYDKSYEIPKDKLKIRRDTLLGSGQFGCVYKALIENDERTEVALKMAKDACPKSALIGILSEIKILSYLGKHPNIVSIQGAYTAEISKGIVYVATELCPLGSLEGYLRKNEVGSNDRYVNANITNNDKKVEHISIQDMIRWSYDIACGMEYISLKQVIHADLSTRNVLLGPDKTAKITDFGLSRRLYDYTNYVKKQQEPLPWRWMSIESLKRLEFSSQSDVWSYGVTLWEIFALGDLPYPGLSWNLDFVDNLVNGLRMRSPPHATPQIYTLMLSTWHMDPAERPTFTELKEMFSDMMK